MPRMMTMPSREGDGQRQSHSSIAGKRRGAEDDRYLWPAMHNAIDEIQPTWVVAENVAGILTMVEQGEVSKVAGSATLFDAFDDLRGRYELRETFTLQRICTDLESHGYAVQPVLVPACAVGAPHRRDRVFIVARRIASDSDNRADGRTAREDEGKGREERIQERHEVRKPDEPNQVRPEGAHDVIADTTNMGRSRRWSEESEQGRQDGHSVGILSDVEGFGESRTSPHPDSHRGCEVDEHMESELADGAKPVSNGGQRNATDTESRRAGGLRIESEEEGTRMRDVVFGNGCRLYLPTDEAGLGRWQDFPSVSPVCGRYDGLSRNVVRYINDKVYDELKEHFRNEDLSCMWQVFQSPQVRQTLGRLYKIHETDLLLKVVFGAQTGRRPESDGDGLSARSDEVSERVLRKLRKQRASPCASQRLQHQEQLTRELGYALPALSFDLALAAKTIEEEVLRMMAYVRKEALKAYGNAIVPQVMYEIFRAIEQVETENPSNSILI